MIFKILVGFLYVYLFKGMLEKVVLEIENFWDDVFGFGEKIEVVYFVWMIIGIYYIVYV